MFYPGIQVKFELFPDDHFFQKGDAVPFHQGQQRQLALLLVRVVHTETGAHHSGGLHKFPAARALNRHVLACDDFVCDKGSLPGVGTQLRQAWGVHISRTVGRVLVILLRLNREQKIPDASLGELL